MKRLLTFEFGTLKLYENYILAQINEGVTIPVEASRILVKIADEHYKGEPFAYISDRKFSYSVDPAIYIETSKIKNLVGFAIVSNIRSAISNAKIESLFSEKYYETFEIISEAKTWANYTVKQHKKKKLSKKVNLIHTKRI
ncbi:hypothetical protein [Formosa sp. PL04]|uniref:hypothetical protein n=1 Tax=Formosa sp. PL04 TaxID=3081755 RepID=UPI002980CC00|nr:hypothetical protein [Formosa sp. PL04]MDW5289877.1 hypothetical protein [Formosa sp. PL04]